VAIRQASPDGGVSTVEMRAFLGLAIASVAMSIDVVLPAFDDIRREFGLPSGSSATAQIITVFFIGLAVGPIPIGMVSDRVGRQVVLRASCLLMVVAAVVSAAAPGLTVILVARFVWGVAAGGIRVAATAMVRDRFAGDAMAREMSFVMTVFITVPVLAPVLGAALLVVLPWRSTFVLCAVFAVGIGCWAPRIGETLRSRDGVRQSHREQFGAGLRAITGSRVALGATVALMPLQAVFSSYLASSERFVGEVYDRAGWFPFVFGGSAIGFGVVNLTVGKHVREIGIRRVVTIGMSALVGVSALLAGLTWAADGTPAFAVFVVLLTLSLMALQSTVPSLNAASLDAAGSSAGTAAAIVASSSTIVGALCGSVIDRAFDGTVQPFTASLVAAAVVSTAVSAWAFTGRR
jgi:MFS transporter, DHA1 family, multidrug resistance protein